MVCESIYCAYIKKEEIEQYKYYRIFGKKVNKFQKTVNSLNALKTTRYLADVKKQAIKNAVRKRRF